MKEGVLAPAGPAADAIASIGWALFAGGAVVFAGVMLLLAVSLRRSGGRASAWLWLGAGGVAMPVLVLAALFVWSLPLGPAWKPVPPPGALVITVTGRMWWWDIRYPEHDGAPAFTTANELRLPAGRPVYLALSSGDVIHSFWVPALGGKMDMLPGRLQHLLVQADRIGRFRGPCAEYCGAQHALMALQVVTESPEAFDAWRRAQARAAEPPTSAQAVRGRDAFLAQRCDACHTVRGTTAPRDAGGLGPDLTHLASRQHLAAGTLAQDGDDARARWIAHVQDLKPGARMPSYGRLDEDTLGALAHWLGTLK